jgi:hypothetical protein
MGGPEAPVLFLRKELDPRPSMVMEKGMAADETVE